MPFEKLKNKENNIFNVLDFKTYEVVADFNISQLSQIFFAEITKEDEQECPIEKAFGIEIALGDGSFGL